MSYDEGEDDFIKAMEAYILQFCPRTRAQTLQQRAMANYKFKLKIGTEVAAHMTRFRTILKYADRLPGEDFVQDFASKLITSESFPKAWKQSFLAQGPQIFDSYKLVDIYQHMDNLALTSATNNEKNKKDKKNKHDNGRRGGRG